MTAASHCDAWHRGAHYRWREKAVRVLAERDAARAEAERLRGALWQIAQRKGLSPCRPEKPECPGAIRRASWCSTCVALAALQEVRQ